MKENKCPESEEVKTSFSVYFGGDHSTPGYIGKQVIDTGCSRFLIGQNTLEKWERMLTRRSGLSTQRVQLEKAMTFRLGNEKNSGNQDSGHTPCWNCWGQRNTACACGGWWSTALVVEEIPERPRLPH